MRSFQGSGVQGNRGGLGKQPLSLAKKGISCELQVRLPRLLTKPRNDSAEFTAMATYCHSEERGKAP